MLQQIATARSLLFVPGGRPDRFQKAVASGADTIVLDLEEAVAPHDKSSAREHVDRWLASGGVGAVRINGLESPWHTEDMDMVSAHRCPLVLPKVHGVGDVHAVAHRLSDGVPIVPLIETAAGVLEATAICSAADVVRVAFGGVDLGTELGVDPRHRGAMSVPRAMVVLASARSGLAPPVDGVSTDLSDSERFVSDAEYARGLGFGGKLCIHPRQVAVVNGAFSPSERNSLGTRRYQFKPGAQCVRTRRPDDRRTGPEAGTAASRFSRPLLLRERAVAPAAGP